MNKVNTIISTNNYFALLEKDINELNPNEIIAKYNYENFIDRAKKYESLISTEALDILYEFNSKIMSLSTKENKSAEEIRVLHKFKIDLEEQIEEIPQEVRKEENDDYTRKLKRAGYIDASVILVILLNIGFIVALAIIGS